MNDAACLHYPGCISYHVWRVCWPNYQIILKTRQKQTVSRRSVIIIRRGDIFRVFGNISFSWNLYKYHQRTRFIKWSSFWINFGNKFSAVLHLAKQSLIIFHQRRNIGRQHWDFWEKSDASLEINIHEFYVKVYDSSFMTNIKFIGRLLNNSLWCNFYLGECIKLLTV